MMGYPHNNGTWKMSRLNVLEGELTRRLWLGFDRVIDAVSDELSEAAFRIALPRELDAAQVREELLNVYKENCTAAMQELLDQDEILEKLAVVDGQLGPVIKGKRYAPPARQSPKEATANFILERKLLRKKTLEEEVSQLEVELKRRSAGLDEVRKSARATVKDLELVKSRFRITTGEEAETEPEDE